MLSYPSIFSTALPYNDPGNARTAQSCRHQQIDQAADGMVAANSCLSGRVCRIFHPRSKSLCSTCWRH